MNYKRKCAWVPAAADPDEIINSAESSPAALPSACIPKLSSFLCATVDPYFVLGIGATFWGCSVMPTPFIIIMTDVKLN